MHLERIGKMKKQYCPYHDSHTFEWDTACGDWCPLFSHSEFEGCDGTYILLDLCHNHWAMKPEDFIDERESNGQEAPDAPQIGGA